MSLYAGKAEDVPTDLPGYAATNDVCAPCCAEQDRWLLDTKPSTHVRTGISIQSHAAYDDTPVGVRENRSATHRRWVELVRFQQALIARICAEQGHLAPRERLLSHVWAEVAS